MGSIHLEGSYVEKDRKFSIEWHEVGHLFAFGTIEADGVQANISLQRIKTFEDSDGRAVERPGVWSGNLEIKAPPVNPPVVAEGDERPILSLPDSIKDWGEHDLYINSVKIGKLKKKLTTWVWEDYPALSQEELNQVSNHVLTSLGAHIKPAKTEELWASIRESVSE